MAPDSDEWEEDSDGNMEDESLKKPVKKQTKEEPKIEQPVIWNEQKEPLKEDEELEFDSNAY